MTTEFLDESGLFISPAQFACARDVCLKYPLLRMEVAGRVGCSALLIMLHPKNYEAFRNFGEEIKESYPQQMGHMGGSLNDAYAFSNSIIGSVLHIDERKRLKYVVGEKLALVTHLRKEATSLNGGVSLKGPYLHYDELEASAKSVLAKYNIKLVESGHDVSPLLEVLSEEPSTSFAELKPIITSYLASKFGAAVGTNHAEPSKQATADAAVDAGAQAGAEGVGLSVQPTSDLLTLGTNSEAGIDAILLSQLEDTSIPLSDLERIFLGTDLSHLLGELGSGGSGGVSSTAPPPLPIRLQGATGEGGRSHGEPSTGNGNGTRYASAADASKLAEQLAWLQKLLAQHTAQQSAQQNAQVLKRLSMLASRVEILARDNLTEHRTTQTLASEGIAATEQSSVEVLGSLSGVSSPGPTYRARAQHTHRHTHTDTDTHARALSHTHTARHLYSHGCLSKSILSSHGVS